MFADFWMIVVMDTVWHSNVNARHSEAFVCRGSVATGVANVSCLPVLTNCSIPKLTQLWPTSRTLNSSEAEALDCHTASNLPPLRSEVPQASSTI